MLRYSLGTLLAAVLLAAVGCAALVNPTPLWSQLVFTATVVLLLGATVWAVPSVRAALATIGAQGVPDAIISDIALPEEDGYALIRHIRALGGRAATVPAIALTVDAQISSETAQPGEEWTGTVKTPVIVGTSAPIPAGSVVRGVVSGVKGAEKGSRAFLVLTVTSITVNGKSHAVSAGTDSIIAGSTRARNLGAIAGGAAAGALIGKAVGGSSKGAVIGGLLGGAAATGAVAVSKGYQVVLKEGTELTFTVNKDARLPT